MTFLHRSAAMAGVLLRAAPFLLALYGIGLNASIGRPIWIDEFLHIVLAAEPSGREAWRVLAQTFSNMNHGQTGIYMMLNYWTIVLTGADAMALRMPSLLSAAFMFGAVIFLFRALGFSVLWQLVVVMALIGQHMLLYFAGEARPYMPLAAASVGMVAYYVGRTRYPESQAVRALGIAAALLGVLMHPYFAVYWPAACFAGWLHHLAVTGQRHSLRTLIAFANPPLVLAGAALFLLLGAVSWLQGTPTFAFDPFQWTRQAGLWVTATDYSHTQFLSGSYGAAAGFTLVLLLGLLLLPARSRLEVGRLWAPAVLVVLAVAISVLLSWMSYRVNYWILFRQWVASVALVAVGIVWLWAEAARLWARALQPLGIAAAAIAAVLVYGQVANINNVRLAEINAALAQSRSYRAEVDCTPPANVVFSGITEDEQNRLAVELINRNAACGGPVWPLFRGYYVAIQDEVARGEWRRPQ